MARVAVLVARDRLAERLVRSLRECPPQIELCERAPHDPARVDRAAFERFDTLVLSPLSPEGPGIGPDLALARALAERLAAIPFQQVIVVSSAAVYPPDHHNVGLLGEDAFIAAGRSEIADAWREAERVVRVIGERGAVRTVLRPAAVLDGGDYFSRLMTGRVAVTYPGHDPTIQLLSPHDLAGAIAAAIAARADGVYNVAPAGGIPLKRALRLARVPRLPIARKLQGAARAVLAPAGLAVPADQVKYIQYSWTVSGDKARETLGFTASRSSAQAIDELTGSASGALPAFDEYGMDPEWIGWYCRTVAHFLHEYYWRVELQGLEHVPRQGRGVLVGMHRGFMPFDGVMALYVLVRRMGRIPRFLIHPSLTKFPFLADFMAKLGGLMACQDNADYVLTGDELLGVFPEGIRGAFTMYRRAYTLGKFGRDEFVRMALRNRAPILPFVTVGSAEIYPILGRVDWAWFKRYTEWPFLPLTPSPVPLPSKWHTRFLPAVHVEEKYPPEAAGDPAIVRAISVEVRQQMQAVIDDMLLRRRSIFAGSIFGPTTEP